MATALSFGAVKAASNPFNLICRCNISNNTDPYTYYGSILAVQYTGQATGAKRGGDCRITPAIGKYGVWNALGTQYNASPSGACYTWKIGDSSSSNNLVEVFFDNHNYCTDWTVVGKVYSY